MYFQDDSDDDDDDGILPPPAFDDDDDDDDNDDHNDDDNDDDDNDDDPNQAPINIPPFLHNVNNPYIVAIVHELDEAAQDAIDEWDVVSDPGYMPDDVDTDTDMHLLNAPPNCPSDSEEWVFFEN